jgi:DNA processing protein
MRTGLEGLSRECLAQAVPKAVFCCRNDYSIAGMSYQNKSISVKTPAMTVETPENGAVIWTEQRLAALRIVRVWDLGSRTLRRIFAEYPDPRAFLKEDAKTWREDVGLTQTQVSGLEASRTGDVDTLVGTLEDANIRFVLPSDHEYPRPLERTDDPPAALFIRGDALRDAPCVAVVGTRKMTEYGKRAATLITQELVASGVIIVSGLAFGVDAEAHEACLASSGVTVAVLPNGTDDASVSPQTNLPLARRILNAGGTLMSEQAPGTPCFPYQFLHRNRLICGLADATVVVEADRDSGSLITAKLALEAGREVLAVPGPIWSPVSRGTNDLIKSGARVCTGASDVFDALGFQNPQRAKQITESRASLPVTPSEQRILNVLDAPRSIDEIARLTSMTLAETNAVMSVLELKGRVQSAGPKTFVRSII